MPNEIAYSALILDDEVMVLKSLATALKKRGFITWATRDQAEAIRFVQNHKPSVACIDLHMPRVNGIEVIKSMREIMPDIRVIVVTGFLEEYEEQLKSLNVRVVEKGAKTNNELEAVICEELELSKKEFEALRNREKPKLRARILVVDDDPEIADFIRDVIIDEGLEAESVHSVDEALIKAGTFKPDIVCTDLEMRKVDGDELIRKMKTSGNHSSVKLYIGMTGATDKVDRFLRAGAREVLTKPFGLTEFITAMRRWIEDLK